jgi:FAD/FMN-containing dehydrogenase
MRLTITKNTFSHGVRDRGYKEGTHPIDVSPLDRILRVDAERKTATVEGQVQLGMLCQATLALGLLPAVVPEYRDFTVAGLINGEGIQSSSHRYGAFSHNVAAVELVLGDGSTVVASEGCHEDLFRVVGGCWGTVGIITAATLRLIPAKPFVRCRYRRFSVLEAYVEALREALEESAFLEGVVFAADCYVLVTGEFVEEPGGLAVVQPLAPGAPYYYQHVRAVVERQAESEDAIATLDYLARSERGNWWITECFMNVALLTGTTWGRRLIDSRERLGGSGSRFEAQSTGVMARERCLVLQDVGVRVERLAEAVGWVQQHLALYPIWNCPILMPAVHRDTFDTRHLVDIGLYGEPRAADYGSVDLPRQLQQLSDCPSLWGVSYLTRDELGARGVIDFARYERVRETYSADGAFLHVEDKVIWVSADEPSPRRPRLWRLFLAFGPRWYFKPRAWALLAAGFLLNTVWSVWRALRGAFA